MGGVDLRKVKSGAALLAAYGVLAGAWEVFLSTIPERMGAGTSVFAFGFDVAGKLLMAGLLIAGISRLSQAWRLGGRGKVAAGLCLIYAVVQACINLEWWLAELPAVDFEHRHWVFGMFEGLEVFGAVGLAAVCGVGIAYMRGLAERVRWPRLAIIGAVVFCLGAICAVVGKATEMGAVVAVIGHEHAVPTWMMRGAGWMMRVGGNAVVWHAGWIWLLLVGGFWMMVWRTARRTRSECRL